MIRYEFKPPNLLEVILLIAILVMSLWLINYTNVIPTTLTVLDNLAKVNPQMATLAYQKALLQAEYTQIVLQWFIFIGILFLATILEGIRDKL